MSYLQEIERLLDLQKQVEVGVEECIRQRDEAQEAAENYWGAWQDAAVYWKAEVERLKQALSDFAEHDSGCPRGYVQMQLSPTLKTEGAGTCTCGLDEELGITKEEEHVPGME